jgi:hypothetical protein
MQLHSESSFFLWPLLIICIAVGSRVFAGNLDKQRITEYIRERGGRVVSIQWNPLGKGWFGSERERIYSVTYLDRRGASFSATCKTSMFAGVYFTENDPIGPSTPGAGFDCHRCGRYLASDAAFCSYCGEPIRKDPNTP